MQFSEAQLVKLFIEQNGRPHREHWPCKARKRNKYIFKELYREFTLPDSGRADVVFFTRGRRCAFIVEFKIVAEVSSIAQVIRYREDYKFNLEGRTNTGAVFAVLAAQYFREDTLLLADHLGIACIQVSPINQEICTLTWLQENNLRRQYGDNSGLDHYRWDNKHKRELAVVNV